MKLLFMLGCFALLASGCSSSVNYGSAKISSMPEGAEVINLEDNSHLGVTPVKVRFAGEANTAKYITLQLIKPGHIERITSFWINRRHATQLEADDNAIDISVELEKKSSN
jgi:hypothetical protein